MYIFKAVRKDNNEYIYGSLIQNGEYCCILPELDYYHPSQEPYLDKETGVIDGEAFPVFEESIELVSDGK